MKKDIISVFAMVLVVVLGVGLRYYMQNGSFLSEEPVTQESAQNTEETGAGGTEDVNNEPTGEITGEAQKGSEQSANDNDWGVVLSASAVTSDGMTLVCSHSGGNPTGELLTGPWYEIEVSEGGIWKPAPTYAEVCWEDIAWEIQPENTTQWEINWTWIYGSLPQGEYRIAKEIMDFRQTGDFDTCRSYAYFTIE